MDPTAIFGLQFALSLTVFVLIAAWYAALPLIWLFNLVGFADLLNALRQAEAIAHFGATWFIPTFLVPLLLVTHVMIFARLLKRNRVDGTTA